MPEAKFTERIGTMFLASAEPKVKAKVAQRMRKPLQEEIRKDFGHIFQIAPTVHFLPFAPQKGKEKEVQGHLEESIKWLKEQDGVYSTFLYEIAGHDDREESPPRYLLIMLCEDNDTMCRLEESGKGKELQQKLMKLCRGKTATHEGIIGINSMLVGIV